MWDALKDDALFLQFKEKRLDYFSLITSHVHDLTYYNPNSS